MAVDLFQGDASTFFCEVSREISEAAALTAVLQVAEARHVALFIQEGPLSEDPGAAMAAVTRGLDYKQVALKRVTLVLPSLVVYKNFQTALFAHFPE